MADPFEDDYMNGLAGDLLGGQGSAPLNGLGSALAQGFPATLPPRFLPPPAGHLLGAVPTYAPPALGDSIQPVKASAPGNADDTSEAVGQEFIEGQRPDLGLEGDTIRTLLPPGFSRDMFQNYWQGGGDVQLSDDRFKDIVDYASTQKPKYVVNVTSPNGEQLQQRIYDFDGSPDYKLSLGRASLFYDQNGDPVGFYDKYDFDPSTKKRSDLREAQTRIMHILGPLHGAKDFEIKYGSFVSPN